MKNQSAREERQRKTEIDRERENTFNNNVKSSHYNRLHDMNVVFNAFDGDAIKYLNV